MSAVQEVVAQRLGPPKKKKSRASTMLEKDWQKQVIDLLHLYGFTLAHFRPAKTDRGWRTPVQADGKGYLDLTCVKGPWLLFVELKTDTGRITPDQQTWIDLLTKVADSNEHVIVDVWRPKDFDRIAEMLRSLR